MSSFPNRASTLTSTGKSTGKKSNTIFIIIIIILAILVILIPIIVWFIARRGIKSGVNESCKVNADCAKGLGCNGTLCIIPLDSCPIPTKPINIDTDMVINFPGWKVTVNWDPVIHADYYILYIGDTQGFDPDTDPSFILLSDTNQVIEEDVPPLVTAYFRIRPVSDRCGVGPLSDEGTFTTGPIL